MSADSYLSGTRLPTAHELLAEGCPEVLSSFGLGYRPAEETASTSAVGGKTKMGHRGSDSSSGHIAGQPRSSPQPLVAVGWRRHFLNRCPVKSSCSSYEQHCAPLTPSSFPWPPEPAPLTSPADVVPGAVGRARRCRPLLLLPPCLPRSCPVSAPPHQTQGVAAPPRTA